MANRPELVLIDGHAVAYRQYFALKGNFSTRTGEPTNAVYGFTRVLLDILQKEKPQYLAVSFDLGLSGREDLYSDYKANRLEMEEDLRTQLRRIAEVVEAFNIPILQLPGYEADDVIGTIARQAETKNIQVRIVSGDRDILQLITSHVLVQLPQRGESDKVWDTQAFAEKYGGLEPGQLVDMKGLMGDPSDNIPGVKGIGEKGATKLLQEYGSLDGIYENIDSIKGKQQTLLQESKEIAYLSKELARIRKDLPLELKLNACIAQDYNVSKVDTLFSELEFRGFRDRLNLQDLEFIPQDGEQLSLFPPPSISDENSTSKSVVPYEVITTEKQLQKLAKKLKSAAGITWDVETTGIDQMSAKLVGIALSIGEVVEHEDDENSQPTNQGNDLQNKVRETLGYYIPVGHREGEQLPLEIVIDALREPLTNPNIPKYAHNAIYDLIVMRRYGIDVAPIGFDTMIGEWVRDPNSKFLGLKDLARQEANIDMTGIDKLIGKGKKQITMDKVAIDLAAPYAAADASVTHSLVGFLQSELEQLELSQFLQDIELPLIPVIADMQMMGVVVDTDFLKEMSVELGQQLDILEQEIRELGNAPELNVNSPKQLNEVLFDQLRLSTKGLKKTTHGFSTDVVTLEVLKDEHEIIPKILDYRELSKLKSTYVDALPQLVNPETGRVHTSFNQTGTNTGRFSSSNPNLQNIPIRTEIGRKVRRAFIAPAGKVLLAVDYSQVELRVMAHISADEGLLNAFQQEQDIHKATAAAVFEVDLHDVTYEQRSFAKRVNFGLMYGMGAFRLARDSDLELAEARKFVDMYFARFPGVQTYIETTKQKASETHLETLLGRKRTFAALQNKDASKRLQAGQERAAINMPIQGTAADILKIAMINLHQALRASGLQGRMILQVHDELVLEVPENELEATTRLVIETMESAYELRAPLKANAQSGQNWCDMEDIH